jgi:cysteine/glycine-rich protein
MALYGGGNIKCVRCNKTVYFQEQANGPGGIYHKNCFTCKECNKRLDSTNVTDNNNVAYCKNCHGKLFGPKGNSYLIKVIDMEIHYQRLL